MPARSFKTPEDVLVYRDGPRRGKIVLRRFLAWRKRQTPSIPERCDNLSCRFHTEPLTWNSQPLKLILDHRNGVNTDNRPSNLRLLCPNCDSQNLATRGGANKGRVIKSSGGFAFVRPDGGRDYHLPAEVGHYAIGGEDANGDEGHETRFRTLSGS